MQNISLPERSREAVCLEQPNRLQGSCDNSSLDQELLPRWSPISPLILVPAPVVCYLIDQLRKRSGRGMGANFVVSLDFELMWGVRDHLTPSQYGKNILGARDAIPRMLDLFETRSIRTTWATVGMVMCETKDELIASFPTTQPSYKEPTFSNYRYVAEIGDNERKDKLYFGNSLAKLVASCPGQEIGSHSFSHYYCLERGQTVEQFHADVEAAVKVAKRHGFELRSFVFPRNQYSDLHLSVLKQCGFQTYRGNESSWIYEATRGSRQGIVRRLCRLVDHYKNLSGYHVPAPIRCAGLVNVPSSRFFRPFSRHLSRFDNLRFQRIFDAIDYAATTNGTFHLWWHPHNFGSNLSENMALLTKVLDRFKTNNDQHGMISANMGDLA